MARGDFNSNFNPNRDINRYLSEQGRAPRSHLDWDTFRKVGQPGTYQAPPGSTSEFQGVRGGGGGPNYDTGVNHYNMFTGLNDTIEKTVGGIATWAAGKYRDSRDGKIDNDSSGGSASSGNGTDMVDDGSMSGGAPGGSNRSQNASITTPSGSRGSRRSRRGDFGQMTQQLGIQMVQGNDNYGTVQGNMGGANVGSGDYDNSFQSKNSGGRQQSNVGNNNSGTQFFGDNNNGGGSPTSPWGPPTATPPPPPPGGGGGTPPPGGGGGGTPPGGGGGTPPGGTPPGGGGKPGKPGSTPPALPPGQQPYGTLTGRPNPPALPPGQGPSAYGNTEGVQGAQETTQGPDRPDQKTLDKGDKIYGIARDPGTTPGERGAAQDKWRGMGFQGPFPREDVGGPETVSTGTTYPTAPGSPTRTGRTGPSVVPGVEPRATRTGQTGPSAIPGVTPTASVGGAPQTPTAGPTLQTPQNTQQQTPVSGPTSPAASGGEKMVMGPRGVSTQEVKSVNVERQRQGLEPGLGYNADYTGLDMNKVNPDAIKAFMPNAPRTDINEQGGSAAGPYGPPAPAAKKAGGGRKAAAPKAAAKTTEGPKSVSAKKAPAAKKAAAPKSTAKPKEKK